MGRDNSGYFFRTPGSGAASGSAQVGVFSDNALVNGAFDYWQAGTSVTVANAASTYLADQWYVKNSLGTNGVITYSQVTGVNNGSLFGASVKITTAPTAAQANGCELYQVLSNKASQPYYNQTASFNISVKALGNVTQVGVQFYYKTTEAKVDTSIGSEVLTTVNTSTFVGCNIAGQALGTSQTAAGVIGVRIRVTAVSSGNTYDLNNGFIVEQGMLNLGTSSGAFARQFADPVQELAACQYFYEKSYDITTAPATATQLGMAIFGGPAMTHMAITVLFMVTKRAIPTVSTWDSAGSSTRQTLWSAAAYAPTNNANGITGANQITSTRSVTFDMAMGSAQSVGIHWTADARI